MTAKRLANQLSATPSTCVGADKGCKSEFSFTNEHMERGHEQEPIARMLYEEMNFVDVDNGGFFDHETYGDSPDGLIGVDGVIEIKSVIAATHYSTITRGSFDPAYKWQLIGHLDCSGRQWVDFVSYCSDFPDGKQLAVYRLTASECAEEIERLRSRRADFINLVAETKRESWRFYERTLATVGKPVPA